MLGEIRYRLATRRTINRLLLIGLVVAVVTAIEFRVLTTNLLPLRCHLAGQGLCDTRAVNILFPQTRAIDGQPAL